VFASTVATATWVYFRRNISLTNLQIAPTFEVENF